MQPACLWCILPMNYLAYSAIRIGKTAGDSFIPNAFQVRLRGNALRFING